MSYSFHPKNFYYNGIICNCGECEHYNTSCQDLPCSKCISLNVDEPQKSTITGAHFVPKNSEAFKNILECATKHGKTLLEVAADARRMRISFGELCQRLNINV